MARPDVSSGARRNFSRRASSYDAAANFQNAAASSLVELLSPSAPFSALEFGCGTGLLSERLLSFKGASLLATDISPEMLSVCSGKLAAPLAEGRLRLAELDFSKPLPSDFASAFDLAASSQAFQWAPSLRFCLEQAALSLKSSGALLLSLPLEGSLSAVASAFSAAGVGFPGLALPSEKALRSELERLFEEVDLRRASFADAPASLPLCLRRLGELGAVNAGAPLAPGPLRNVLRLAGTRLFSLEYEVALCLCSNPKRRS